MISEGQMNLEGLMALMLMYQGILIAHHTISIIDDNFFLNLFSFL
jgi:hypothetical protein